MRICARWVGDWEIHGNYPFQLLILLHVPLTLCFLKWHFPHSVFVILYCLCVERHTKVGDSNTDCRKVCKAHKVQLKSKFCLIFSLQNCSMPLGRTVDMCVKLKFGCRLTAAVGASVTGIFLVIRY